MVDEQGLTAATDKLASKTNENASQTTSTEWSPQTVLSTLPHLPPSNQPTPMPFLHLLTRLKTTKREGWRRFGITTGESIADHMYRMAVLTMLTPASLAQRLDLPRCTKMALVHDVAESIVGDITPVDGIAKAEKSRREAATIDYLCDELLGAYDGGAHGREIRALWHEYEADETLEARYVHDVDKMELLLQTVDYEREHGGQLELDEFTRVAQRIVLPEVRRWSEEVLAERKAYWREKGRNV